MKRNNNIRRDTNNMVIGGVCSGIGRYFDIDPVFIRLIWAALFFFLGIGALFYILCWFIIPEED